MDYMYVLAAAEKSIRVEDIDIVPIDFIWEQITALSWLQAVIAISFGIVWLLYGWRIFKILVVISFALLGMVLGMMVAEKISGQNQQLLGAVIGLVGMAAISLPLMRWAVSILGAVAGGILTSGVWYAAGLNESYILAGTMIGVVDQPRIPRMTSVPSMSGRPRSTMTTFS